MPDSYTLIIFVEANLVNTAEKIFLNSNNYLFIYRLPKIKA